MAVKLITKERIERTMTRTDHARLCAGDVKALKRLSAEIRASISLLCEYSDRISSRLHHRPNAEVLLAESPQVVDGARPTTVEARSRLVQVDTKPGG